MGLFVRRLEYADEAGVTSSPGLGGVDPLVSGRKIYSQTEDFGNGEHYAECLYGITEQLHGLRFLGVGGSITKLCSQKALDKIDDTGITDNDESHSGRLIELIWMIQVIFGRLETAREL